MLAAKHYDGIVAHRIDKPVLVRNAPRPTSFVLMAKGFGFSGAFKRMPSTLANEFGDALEKFGVILGPFSKVLESLRLKGDHPHWKMLWSGITRFRPAFASSKASIKRRWFCSELIK